MLRIVTSLSVVGLLCGCATPTRTQAPRSTEKAPSSFVAAPSLLEGDWLPPSLAQYTMDRDTDRAASTTPAFEGELTPLPWSYSAVPLASYLAEDPPGREGENYMALKGGMFYPSESDLDPGAIFNVAYGRYFTRLISIEVEGGYIVPDVDAPSSDLFAIPLMLNGRVNIPLWILEVYGGLGIGYTYYDIEVGSFDDHDWLITGSAFLGANLVLADKLTGGLEVKYYVTDELDNTDLSLDAVAVMVTLGWRF
jgi:hypothetical protein